MDSFVKKFQPELYDNWKKGQDNFIHPSDYSKIEATTLKNVKVELEKLPEIDKMLMQYRADSIQANSNK